MDDLISKQAAIDALQKEINKGIPPFDDTIGAIRCGVRLARNIIEDLPSALSTNLAEVGTDCISRKAAIDALRKMQTYKMFSGDDMLLIDQAGAQTELMLLQSAEPKRGRWVGKYPVTSVCSECGYLINDSKVKVFAFCPNCGADMREVTT